MRRRLTWTERLFLVFCGLLTAGAAVFCVCTQPKSMAEEFYNCLDMAYIREICIVTPGSRYTDNPAPELPLDAADCAALLEQLSVLDFPGHRIQPPVAGTYTLILRIFCLTFSDGSQIYLEPDAAGYFAADRYIDGVRQNVMLFDFREHGRETVLEIMGFGDKLLKKYYDFSYAKA